MLFIHYAKATMHCLHVFREMCKTQSFYWVNVMYYIMKGLQYISALQHEGDFDAHFFNRNLVDWTPFSWPERRGKVLVDHTLWVMGIFVVDRGNIKMDLAVTQPMGSPKCLVWKITMLMEWHSRGESPGILFFEKLFRQVCAGERIIKFWG